MSELMMRITDRAKNDFSEDITFQNFNRWLRTWYLTADGVLNEALETEDYQLARDVTACIAFQMEVTQVLNS